MDAMRHETHEHTELAVNHEPLEYTRHALARKTQRGLAQGDVDFIIRHGTDVGSGGYLLTNKDASWLVVDAQRKVLKIQRWLAEGLAEDTTRIAQAVLAECRADIHRAERLRNVKVVVAGKYIVTGYATTPRTQKRSLRWAKGAGLGFGAELG